MWIALIAIFVAQIKILSGVKSLGNRLSELENSLRVRQGNISSQRATRANPKVDSKARTVVRDTHDLPLTGRMSQGVHRKKREIDSLTEDS